MASLSDAVAIMDEMKRYSSYKAHPQDDCFEEDQDLLRAYSFSVPISRRESIYRDLISITLDWYLKHTAISSFMNHFNITPDTAPVQSPDKTLWDIDVSNAEVSMDFWHSWANKEGWNRGSVDNLIKQLNYAKMHDGGCKVPPKHHPDLCTEDILGSLMRSYAAQCRLDVKLCQAVLNTAIQALKTPGGTLHLTKCSDNPNLGTLPAYDTLTFNPVPEVIRNLADTLEHYDPGSVELTTFGDPPGDDNIEGSPEQESGRRSRFLRWGYWALILSIFMAVTSVIQVYLAWISVSKVPAPQNRAV